MEKWEEILLRQLDPDDEEGLLDQAAEYEDYHSKATPERKLEK